MNKKIRVLIHNLFVRFAPKFVLERLVKCKEIARWLADEESLSFMQKVELFFHLLYCPPCWVYALHLEKLKEAAQRMFKKEAQKCACEHGTKIDELTNKIIQKHSK